MFRSTRYASVARWLLLAALLSVTTACVKKQNAELEWARAALQRNPNLELVATDEQSGMFTLRDRHSGEVHAVALRDLAAAPLSQLVQPAQPAPVAAVSAPVPAVASAPEQPAAPAATAAEAAPPAESAMSQTPVASNEKGYTIERTDGRLKISGPGISVVSAGTTAAGGQTSATAPASEPIICEGQRMLHLDNRQMHVDGDAITVRGGCELYITNSNIVASGVGIIVHDGIVHIDNSYVEGASGSFAADSQAKVFVRGSTFQGLSRRDQLAMVQDQGGNQWR